MIEVEEAGYPIVLTVHDEIVTEPIDSGQFSAQRLSGLLSAVPPWAQGLPLAAEGYEAARYRK
jgi:DNA polymerase bacteriophage-type